MNISRRNIFATSAILILVVAVSIGQTMIDRADQSKGNATAVVLPALTGPGDPVTITEGNTVRWWTIDEKTQTSIQLWKGETSGASVRTQARENILAVESVTAEKAVTIGGHQGWQITAGSSAVIIHSFAVVGRTLIRIDLVNPKTVDQRALYARVLKTATFQTP